MTSQLKKRSALIVAAVLAVLVASGFALRLDAARHPGNPGADSYAYHRIAKAIYQRHTYGDPGQRETIDTWAPGAPLIYAGVYFIFGLDNGDSYPFAPRALLAVLGALTILVAFLLARALCGSLPRWCSDTGGLFAAGAVAFYRPLIDYNSSLMSEPMAAFMLATSLLFLIYGWVKERWFWWLGSGLFLGALILVRPEFLLLGCLLLFVVAARFLAQRRLKAAVLPLLMLCLGLLVTVGPWTVRNYFELHRFVPVSAGGGKVLYIGTFKPGDGLNLPTKKVLIARYPDLRRKLSGRTGAVSTYEAKRVNIEPFLDRVAAKYPGLSRDQSLRKQALANLGRYFSADPIGYTGMFLGKAIYMWKKGASDPAKAGFWLTVHLVLLALGLAGLVLLALRNPWDALIIGLPIVLMTFTLMFFQANPRRAMPLLPLVFSLAGVSVAWLSLKASEAVLKHRSFAGARGVGP